MLINSVDGGDIMAAFERFRSLCGGSKADYNTKISIGANNKKRRLKAKLKKRKVQLKKANKRAQDFSINNLRQEHETKLVTCIPNNNSFDGKINFAVQLAQTNNKKEETKSINTGRKLENKSIDTGRKVEKRMNMLNKYGLKGIMLDR